MRLAPFRTGLREAAGQPRLAVTLWLVNLVLAAAAAAPAVRMLEDALDYAPEGDRLRQAFSFGIFMEMMRAEPARFGLALSFAICAAVLGLLANVFTSGGVLDVLTTGDRRRFLHRFGRGAGHFFGRFLRLGIVAGAVLLAAAGLVMAAIRALSRRLEDAAWPPTDVALGLVRIALAFGIAVVALVALDLARIRVVRDDSGRAVRLYWSSLGLVLRHPLATLGLWSGNALVLGLVLAAYLAFRNAVPAGTWTGIGLMLVAQQLVMLARAGLRVALFGGEIALVDRLVPKATPVEPEAPPAG